MQLILKPVSHPDLDEVIVDGAAFAIGRSTAPFSSYDNDYTRQLSTRHARIFERHGGVYIADLGSLNGTFVNDVKVTNAPVPLKREDEIACGGLRFKLEVFGSAAVSESEDEAEQLLVLTPRRDAIDPIVIRQFPFPINKSSKIFARYLPDFEEQLGFLSRHHAYVFLDDGVVYLEDLGSTNGTFVGGHRLGTEPVALADDDVVAFGGDHFVYSVTVVAQKEATQTNASEPTIVINTAIKEIDDNPKTIYVSDADDWIDMWTADEAAEESIEELEPEKRWPIVERWRELRAALVDPSGRPSRTARITGLIVLAAVVASTALYWLGGTSREIERLLESGEFEAAACAAASVLAEGEDPEIAALGLTATLKATIPQWIAAMDAGELDTAHSVIAGAAECAAGNQQTIRTMQAMGWATDAHAHFAGAGADRVRLFRDEQVLDELALRWRDMRNPRAALTRATQTVAAFAAFERDVLAQQRRVQKYADTELPAIAELRENTLQALRSGDQEPLTRSFDNFQRSYPTVAGVVNLQADLRRLTAVTGGNSTPSTAAALKLRVDDFLTPVFRTYVEEVVGQVPPQVRDRFEAALAGWRDGEFPAALAALTALVSEGWNTLAEPSLERLGSLHRDYLAYNDAKRAGSADRLSLIQLFMRLDQQVDANLVALLRPDFERARVALVGQAAVALTAARTHWDRYQAAGPLDTSDRVKAITPRFESLASALSDAYDSIAAVEGTYQALRERMPEDADGLLLDIRGHIDEQRGYIERLQAVPMRERKLRLLPEPNPQGE